MPVSSRFWRNTPSISPTVGKFCTPANPMPLELGQEDLGQVERIGAVDAGEHRRVLHDRQHLAGHVDDDLVGVAVRQQPGQRTAPGHAVATGVVDHDQVDPAGLLPLGRQPGARRRRRRSARGARSCPRKRSRIRSRDGASWRPTGDLVECGERGGGELRVVDVLRRPARPAGRAVWSTSASIVANRAASARGPRTAGPARRAATPRLRAAGSAPAPRTR